MFVKIWRGFRGKNKPFQQSMQNFIYEIIELLQRNIKLFKKRKSSYLTTYFTPALK